MSTMQLTYSVQVTGLEQAAAQAQSASRSADLAAGSVRGFAQQSMQVAPLIASGIHAFNSAQRAAREAHEALTTLNPEAALGALLAMTSVVANLTQTVRLLRESTAAAAAGQTVLAAMSGQWWMIPLALGAGALVGSQLKSMQTGGQSRGRASTSCTEASTCSPAAATAATAPST